MAGGEPTRRLITIVAAGECLSHDPPSGILGLG